MRLVQEDPPTTVNTARAPLVMLRENLCPNKTSATPWSTPDPRGDTPPALCQK